ncbi:hypothetical protein [Psychrobacter sp. GP33]|uniref:hypothetical protein n=1 Tax=Psychrobacter sp. GP33 TaxID=2758709 RepID=UPI00217506EC|nr:hypothetical protein [Psychrobacter sp. GP33]
MRSTIFKLIMSLSTVAIVACTPALKEQEDSYGAGFITVNETLWAVDHTKPYPFTVAYGEIVCGLPHRGLGPQVYFMPENFTDESYIGTPLNQAAADSLERDGDRPNVPYSIKKGADLSEAIQIGLKVCKEQQDFLDNGG